MRTTFKASSKEFVGIPVTELTGKDITGDVVEMGFTLERDDTPTAWAAGVWRDVLGETWAAVLIGPGSPHGPLTPGKYWMQLRVTDNPEIPDMTSPNRITIY